MAGATEYVVQMAATGTTDVPPAFTGCHAHGSETYVPPDIEICPSINSFLATVCHQREKTWWCPWQRPTNMTTTTMTTTIMLMTRKAAKTATFTPVLSKLAPRIATALHSDSFVDTVIVMPRKQRAVPRQSEITTSSYASVFSL